MEVKNASSGFLKHSSPSSKWRFLQPRFLNPPCLGSSDGPKVNSEGRLNDSVPSVATTAVGMSIFLLTTTACLVIKSRLLPCQSHR